MEVGISSAVSRFCASWLATRRRDFSREARGSRKMRTEGPAPLRAAPRMPLPFSSWRQGSSGQSAAAIRLVDAVFEGGGKQIGTSLGEGGEQEHRILHVGDGVGSRIVSGEDAAGFFGRQSFVREQRGVAATSLSGGWWRPGLRDFRSYLYLRSSVCSRSCLCARPLGWPVRAERPCGRR